MPEDPSWRHKAAYHYIETLDPAGLAWEFLRRNAGYRHAYDRLPRRERSDPDDALTAQWGLRFPDGSDPRRHRRGPLLDTRDRPRNTDPRTPAGHPRPLGPRPRD